MPKTLFCLGFYNEPMAWDICIHGDGIAGNTLALLLAKQRLRVGLVGAAKPDSPMDVRTYALNAASRQTLQGVGVWPAQDTASDASWITPVSRMQVWGDEGGDIHFDASSLGQTALTWMVDVPVLEQALRDAVAAQPLIERVSSNTSEQPPAKLQVVCEGKASAMRAQLGVSFDAWPYPHHALATRLLCDTPHGGVARQWFSEGDILAFLPMEGVQGRTVGVVWSTSPDRAAQYVNTPPALCDKLAQLSRHALGNLTLQAPAAVWPLQRAQARQWTGRNVQGAWVLAGDAAHTVHPLAGQGLNMGLADVKLLAELLQAREFWRPVDDARLLRRYERERKVATQTMVSGTDSLQWLFSQPEALWAQVRNWGLNSVNQTQPLKLWLAKQAMNL